MKRAFLTVPRIPSQPWVDSRVVVRGSKIEGFGLFAAEVLPAGALVIVWGGRLVTEDERQSGTFRERSLGVLEPGLYIGARLDEPDQPDEFMNHACDPTLWMKDGISFVTRRPVAAGEELTADYALFEFDAGWQMPCLCGLPCCRGIISGADWQRPELQERYAGFFSPFVEGLIHFGRPREVKEPTILAG